MTERPYSMSVADSSRYVGYSQQVIREAVTAGTLPRIPAEKGHKVLIRTDDLIAWVESGAPSKLAA